MKKLAIVLGSCVPGGVTQALSDFIHNLAQFEYQITLLLREPETYSNIVSPDGIDCQSWSKRTSFRGLLKNHNFKFATKFLTYRFLTLWYWRNFPKKTVCQARLYDSFSGEYDCVIAYHMILNDDSVVALEKVKAKRRVLWIHGRKTYLKKNLEFFNRFYSQADLIVAVSKDTEERFDSLFPKLADKSTTIHNFYDFDTIYSKADEPLGINKTDDVIMIVSTGRLSKEKGFDRVPEVTKKLADDGYNIKWYIVGDGDKRESIATDIAEKGLKDNVILTGFITNPYPYVKQCDIYVQPSYTEGFCTSTMEAKILRRPVVTTDVPGMNEQFVNEYDGLIVESSVDGLYLGIKRLIDDKELYQSITDHLNNETFSNAEEVQKAIKAIDG